MEHALGEPCDICNGKGFDSIGRPCRRLIRIAEESFESPLDKKLRDRRFELIIDQTEWFKIFCMALHEDGNLNFYAREHDGGFGSVFSDPIVRALIICSTVAANRTKPNG